MTLLLTVNGRRLQKHLNLGLKKGGRKQRRFKCQSRGSRVQDGGQDATPGSLLWELQGTGGEKAQWGGKHPQGQTRLNSIL